ncbi:MAG: alpha/beta fold hydrolase [Pseudomonadota bacterium]
MRLLRGLLLSAVILAVAAWVIVCTALLVQRHSLIYPFDDWPSAEDVSGLPGARVARVAAEDGIEILAWVVPPRQNRPVVLYFTGNSGSLPATALKLAEYALAGFGIVAMNYRGAGGAEGAPDQDDIISDGVRLYDALPELLPEAPLPPVIAGVSLGAAVASQVAVLRPAKAVLLEAPFARLCEAAEFRYPVVPACLILPDQRWETIDVIGRIDAPLLLQHGLQDDIIPAFQGQKLFDAAPQPKTFVPYPQGNHNDLRLFGAGIDAIRFLEDLS